MQNVCFLEMISAPRFGAVCFNALKSFGFDRDSALHEGRVLLFDLMRNGYKIEHPRGIIGKSLARKEIDKKRLWQNRAICFPEKSVDPIDGNESFSIGWFFLLTTGLAHADRTFLYRRFVLGLSIRELAEHYGCAEGTIKSRTSRIVGKLKESKS